jgi:hypothetical protein
MAGSDQHWKTAFCLISQLVKAEDATPTKDALCLIFARLFAKGLYPNFLGVALSTNLADTQEAKIIALPVRTSDPQDVQPSKPVRSLVVKEIHWKLPSRKER